MGVAGAGKTTVGRVLSEELGWEFIDGDSLHPAANTERMRLGMPLTDQDRLPWLAAIRRVIEDRSAKESSVVLACSALKERFRQQLQEGLDVSFVYLKGEPELLRERLRARSGHFFSPDLLPSQLESLEEPTDALVVDASKGVLAIVREIRSSLLANQ